MEFLYYDIYVALLIAVFYIFYRLLLANDHLHQLNRFVLLGTAVVSFILPLCIITVHHVEVLAETPTTIAQNITTENRPVNLSFPWWQTALPIVFWAGVIISLLWTALSITKVSLLIRHCEKYPQDDGTVIAVSDKELSPFSWMHFIVMSRRDYAHPDNAILIHEREHIRKHHSWDVLAVDIMTSFQWFNPTMWMLRSDLRNIHEYEADAAVLSNGINARDYQYLLVRKALAVMGYSIVNGISSHSVLKQRITMMNSNSRERLSWLKALYVIPVVVISLIANARTETEYKVVPLKVAKETVETENAETPKATVQISTESKAKEEPDIMKNDSSLRIAKIQNVVNAELREMPDELPTYPGGSSEVKTFFANNTKYPEAAKRYRLEGRMVISFIVNEDGSVAAPKVEYDGTKSAIDKNNDVVNADVADNNPTMEAGINEGKAELERTAITLALAMPKWKPAIKNGKNVKFRYYMPVTFKYQ